MGRPRLSSNVKAVYKQQKIIDSNRLGLLEERGLAIQAHREGIFERGHCERYTRCQQLLVDRWQGNVAEASTERRENAVARVTMHPARAAKGWQSGRFLMQYANNFQNCLFQPQCFILVSIVDFNGSRSLIPSHMPSCSAFRRPVTRFVFPHRRKSASFNCPMNACLHASGLGERRSLSTGGEARWRVIRKGMDCDELEANRETVWQS